MGNTPLRGPSECRILIVDDEQNICQLLKDSLEGSYLHVDSCGSAEEALERVEQIDYDIVVADLRLPGRSGMEVVRAVKEKDEFCEVIVITGYASIESASEAINLGVTSYLAKPLSITDFLVQVERAVASRIFHLKSLLLMDHSHQAIPEVKDHIRDITNLYYFSRKLLLALEVPEIMRIILDEANERLNACSCVVGVKFLDFCEVFSMPRLGETGIEDVREALLSQWDNGFDMLDRGAFEKGEIPLVVFKGRQGKVSAPSWKHVCIVPMTVLGQTIGFFGMFWDGSEVLEAEREQFMHVFTSMISSVVEHGYRDMQAKLQAKTDSLTGIANHRMLHETLEREMARADRYLRRFCLALIDIDDFKKINDTHGHLVGDAVLIDLARRMSEPIRRGDVLARYGGEEFALVLPDTALDGARTLAHRVCSSIASRPFAFAQTQVPYTISVGLTEYNGARPCPKDALIGEADAALYRSKQEGKNRVSVH